MKKIKIYLDTSVISMLDNSTRGIMTKRFFEIVRQKDYELAVSEVVDNEIDDAEASKRNEILHFLSKLNIISIPYSEESYNLAWSYVFEGVLTDKHMDDLLHMAYAVIHECDIIVSWNCKHIVNPVNTQKLNFCNVLHGYRPIMICTPQDFIDFLFKESENGN
jgi:hypothetical protein